MKHATLVLRRFLDIESRNSAIVSECRFSSHAGQSLQPLNALKARRALADSVQRQFRYSSTSLLDACRVLQGQGPSSCKVALLGNAWPARKYDYYTLSLPAEFQFVLKRNKQTQTRTSKQPAAQGHQRTWTALPAYRISEIFGPEVDSTIGNQVLKTLQQQRIDGTLDKGVYEDGINDEMLAKALVWLRQTRPLDEDAAVVARIEREERELEEQHLVELKKIANWMPQDRAKIEGIYGRSALDELHERGERKRADAKAAKTTDGASSETSLIQSRSHRSVLDRRKESAVWVQKYREKAQIIKVLAPEKITTAQRLLPSAAFVAVFVSCCVLFARYHQDLGNTTRLFPDLAPATATVLAIVGANAAIHLAWMIPFFWRKLNQYFLLVTALPKPLSLLGSTFSHQSFVHLLANMTFLWIIGPKLHDQIGRQNFVPLYLSCGVVASFISLSRAVLTRNMLQTSLGASGAVTGAMAAWLYLNPSAKFTLIFLPDNVSPAIPSRLILGALLFLELFSLWKGVLRVDHYAHLGGYFAGLAGAHALRYPKDVAKGELPSKKGEKRKASASGTEQK